MVFSLNEVLDFELAFTDAGCLVPVYLGSNDCTVRETHLGGAFALSPPTLSITLAQPGNFPDPGASGNGLDP
jgi:hypothetical protein